MQDLNNEKPSRYLIAYYKLLQMKYGLEMEI